MLAQPAYCQFTPTGNAVRVFYSITETAKYYDGYAYK